MSPLQCPSEVGLQGQAQACCWPPLRVICFRYWDLSRASCSRWNGLRPHQNWGFRLGTASVATYLTQC